MRLVVLGQCRGELRWHIGHEQILRNLSRHQDKYPIATILVMAILQAHARTPARPPDRPAERAVHATAYRDLMRVGAVPIPESFDVHTSASNPRLGRLMVAAAGTYYLHFLRGSRQPVIFAVGCCLAYLWTGIVAHLVLTWPSGRIANRFQGAMVAVCYLAAVGSQVGQVRRRPSSAAMGVRHS